MHPPDHLVAAFRASGRKVTPQRERIFRVLHDNPTHPTAEAVHAEVVADMPTVSLRTVYATLHELADMGELRRIQLGTGSARFDTDPADHHHLVCTRCGSVQDVHVDYPDVAPPTDHDHGFVVETTQIVFRGRCTSCAAETPGPDSGIPQYTEEQHFHG